MRNHQTNHKFRCRLYQYVVRLIKFLSKLPYDPVTQEIKRQLTRSGTSVGANYFEARGASSKKDYKRFFCYSLKSANESKFWLSLLRDCGLTPKAMIDENDQLLSETKEISNIFASSIITMKGGR